MKEHDDIYYINCVDLMFTLACPLACDYCWVHQEPHNLKLEDIKRYLEQGGFYKVFPFGGEPLLNPEVVDYVFTNTPIQIEALLTNGVLVPKYIDMIKKIGCRVQFSVDGYQKVHDKHRKYRNGKGSFVDVIKGIKSCIDNKIEWSMHGVVTKDTLPYYAKSMKWYWKVFRHTKGISKAIAQMGRNTFQIIFEEDWTDKDIDIAIQQHYDIVNWIMKEKGLNNLQKRNLLWNIITRKGSICGGGTTLLAVDDKMNVYPCHRLATEDIKEDFKLCNIFEPEKLTNVKLYNSFNRLYKTKFMYSAITDLKRDYKDYMFMACPATNFQLSGNIFYQSAKYNVMTSEINRAINDIIKKQGLDKYVNKYINFKGTDTRE